MFSQNAESMVPKSFIQLQALTILRAHFAMRLRIFAVNRHEEYGLA